jgi:hypothetical protein
VTGRNAAGVRIMDLRNGDKVTAVEPLMSKEEEDAVVDNASEAL